MHLPCHKDDISMGGPHGFVKIMHMYLRTADIWICWFARFAFVKPSRLHHLHFQTGDMCVCITTNHKERGLELNYTWDDSP